ncbi:MAG: murein biosynthesis integral membrane protein MurJ [Sulfurovaceae bacterium]
MRIQAILTNSFGILTSRITGLFRDVFMASALGASIYSDIFFVAFKIPNLFRRIFAEGAFTQSFMPSFIASKQKGVFGAAIFLRFLLFLVIISLIVSLFPEVLTKLMAFGWDSETIALAAPLTAINFWYLDLIFIVTFLATLLQYKEYFAVTAISTSLLNIAMVAALWLFMHDDPKVVAYALSIAVVIGGLLQVITHIWAISTMKMHKIFFGGFKYLGKKDVSRDTKKFNKLFLPAMWGNSTPQINAFLDTLLASFLMTGSISYLFYANRIFQLPLALFAIATATALFPSISKAIKNGKNDAMERNLKKAFWLLLFLLGISTTQTTSVLFMYLAGLVPFGLAKLFSLVLYASHKQAKAAKIATYSLLINILASLALIKPMGASGLALAGSIGGWVLFAGTLKEIGSETIKNMFDTRYTLLFLLAVILLAPLFYFLNELILPYF